MSISYLMVLIALYLYQVSFRFLIIYKNFMELQVCPKIRVWYTANALYFLTNPKFEHNPFIEI